MPQKTNFSLVGFSRDAIFIEDVISLPMTTRQAPKQVMVMLDLLVVNVASIYNAILGRLSMSAL